MASTSDDIIYYNLTIGTTNGDTSGILYKDTAFKAVATINNSQPIIADPSQYYCSIIRLLFPGYAIPLVGFDVVQPVTDINKGIYSFTLTYGATSSAQTFYIYVPSVKIFTPPVAPSATQDFTTGYYNIYDYDHIIKIMNTALETAFNEIKTLVGVPIAAAQVPFFVFNHDTSKIDLYADKAFFDESLATPIKIYFNSPSYIYMKGFYYISESVNQPQGRDNYFVINSDHTLNDKTIGATTYVMMSQQYISLQYMSPLKSILVATTMNIRPESYNIAVPDSIQNVGYSGIMTDYCPDVSVPQPGISSYKFIYNATSLYRVFEFYQRSPVYNIQAALFWSDNNGQTYPLYIPRGQLVDIKFMFIKKSIFTPNQLL